MTYAKVVDSIIVGPHDITDTEAERTLGIDSYQYNKSRRRRDTIFGRPQEPDTAATSPGKVH